MAVRRHGVRGCRGRAPGAGETSGRDLLPEFLPGCLAAVVRGPLDPEAGRSGSAPAAGVLRAVGTQAQTDLRPTSYRASNGPRPDAAPAFTAPLAR
ncbi:hypothetical protein OG889_02510 [Streptomyces sp. NBC_00481]|uniref:hypothetical protein n=1 Tax=unclassified Streptomyces TaxID=2593676 RepID=UPI002DDB2838|nr:MULTISPECIES: hypothetical protein [unclassified Streptomyces]WRY93691.1 hypothetical protein OG889_02510 [Streptomyces sp. NBC_00481]